jgi:threonine synthase
LEAGSTAIACASTGNTSASAAAYGALCGLKSIVIVPQRYIASGKFAQAIAYGARIITINGNFDQALEIVRSLVQKYPITLVNSLNPHRIEGQKTAAFEIIDLLGDAPDYLFIPVGNAGNITAYWKGFVQYRQMGKAKKTPKMMGFEAEGAAPIARGYPIDKPSTIATAIRIGNPASWQSAIAARDESGGIIDYASDAEILAAQKMLATKEGIFVEPASAASLAGLIKLVQNDQDFSRQRVVCILTGSGLKDPELAIENAEPFPELPASLSAVEQALDLEG